MMGLVENEGGQSKMTAWRIVSCPERGTPADEQVWSGEMMRWFLRDLSVGGAWGPVDRGGQQTTGDRSGALESDDNGEYGFGSRVIANVSIGSAMDSVQRSLLNEEEALGG